MTLSSSLFFWLSLLFWQSPSQLTSTIYYSQHTYRGKVHRVFPSCSLTWYSHQYYDFPRPASETVHLLNPLFPRPHLEAWWLCYFRLLSIGYPTDQYLASDSVYPSVLPSSHTWDLDIQSEISLPNSLLAVQPIQRQHPSVSSGVLVMSRTSIISIHSSFIGQHVFLQYVLTSTLWLRYFHLHHLSVFTLTTVLLTVLPI